MVRNSAPKDAKEFSWQQRLWITKTQKQTVVILGDPCVFQPSSSDLGPFLHLLQDGVLVIQSFQHLSGWMRPATAPCSGFSERLCTRSAPVRMQAWSLRARCKQVHSRPCNHNRVRVRLRGCGCGCENLCVSVSVSQCLWVCQCVSVCERVGACVRACMNVCVCACVFVCVCLCVCSPFACAHW